MECIIIWFIYFLTLVQSHMFVGSPPPFQSDLATSNIDLLLMPMNGDIDSGIPPQPFPCKGHHEDYFRLGKTTPTTWIVGEKQSFSVFGNHNNMGPAMARPQAGTQMQDSTGHSGGSCQVSLSYDRGGSFVVIQNYEGRCPRVNKPGQITNDYPSDGDENFDFMIPATFPSGDNVIFAWTWINISGNREFYMSCSPVNIFNPTYPRTVSVTPEGNPLLIANIAAIKDQCFVQENEAIIYPPEFAGKFPAVNDGPFPAESSLKLAEFAGPKDCASGNKSVVDAINAQARRFLP